MLLASYLRDHFLVQGHVIHISFLLRVGVVAHAVGVCCIWCGLQGRGPGLFCTGVPCDRSTICGMLLVF